MYQNVSGTFAICEVKNDPNSCYYYIANTDGTYVCMNSANGHDIWVDGHTLMPSCGSNFIMSSTLVCSTVCQNDEGTAGYVIRTLLIED